MTGIDRIQNKMNLTTKNLSLISDNIANINTPNYKRKYIDVQNNDFASVLQSNMKKTNEKHSSGKFSETEATNTVDAYMRTDENGVDIDTEVLELHKNRLFHSSLVNLLNGDINKIKTIITSK